MEAVLALLVGLLFAVGVYLLLARDPVRLVLGLALIGNAANLLVLTVGRLTPLAPPFVDPATGTPPAPYANPLPQALVLTAIVIGFGLVSYTLVLVLRRTRSRGRLLEGGS